MKIALVSSPLIQTPPIKYGGIERIVYWLGRELMQRGHSVVLFGKTGSYLDLAIVCPYDGGEDDGYADLIHDVDTDFNFDVIHDITHDKILVRKYPELKTKTINTLQGLAARGPNTTCISEAQRNALGYPSTVPVIYQGIPVDEYPPIDNPTRDYFLYMGSFNDYKGVDIAVDVCRKAGRTLLMAGVCWDPSYEEKLIKPFLSEQIKMVGEVGGQEKMELLRNARALLHPVRWTEPGAIIVGEALACGVPVIGSNNGVLPELVNPAVGIICEVQHFDSYQKMSGGAYNVEQWMSALDRIDEIDRKDCADYARATLTDIRMTNEYLTCYDNILRGLTW